MSGYCAYLDAENAMDPTLAESIGVNTEELLISRPNSAEKMLSIVDVLTKSGSVDVIVVDSVSSHSFISICSCILSASVKIKSGISRLLLLPLNVNLMFL